MFCLVSTCLISSIFPFIVSLYDGTDVQNDSFNATKPAASNTPAYTSFSAVANAKKPLLPGTYSPFQIHFPVILDRGFLTEKQCFKNLY